ncbi:hypothetical protein [Geodermatophilus sp. CPCC 206100]|uniref:hypothetical protein n=1 Tax=Geodermatophilus sp. CPCC 206100 TaxID=3020054 RepID=UPI003B008665
MPHRGLLARVLLGIGLLVGGLTALVGGLALPPSGMVAIGLAGLVAGALAGGVARESHQDRRATVDAAWKASAGTVSVLLVLSGAAVIGGALLSLLVGAAGAAAVVAAWSVRAGRTPSGRVLPTLPATASRPGPLPSVSGMTTGDLGREWVRTTEALAGRLDPPTRQAIVARRQETLDELERRDPVGFARWLAGTPLPGSDPAGHLRHGDPAA